MLKNQRDFLFSDKENKFVMRRWFLILVVLFVVGMFNVSSLAQTQSQSTYILQIQGITWDRASLNILLVKPTNLSGWDPIYLNSTLRAIGQWNDAISYFSSHYAGYDYLSLLTLQTTVSNSTEPGFDIYIGWSGYPPLSASSELGLTEPTFQQNTILNCSVTLSLHANHGEPLTNSDMQNIALHEIGHCLGLGHSNFTGDVMYPVYTLMSQGRGLSTLDLYGVATVFSWLSNIQGQQLTSNPVSLPTNIMYSYLPVSSQNAVPQTLANNPVVETLVLVYEILAHPEVTAILVIYVAVLVGIAVYPRKRKKKDAPSSPS